MLRNLGLGATLAATAAQAIIIPSTVSVEGNGLDAMALAGVDPFQQIVKADCRGCLFAQRTESEAGPGISWTDGVDNALLAKFTISDNLRKLSFNDIEVYPPTQDILFPAQRQQPQIVQVPTEATVADVYNATRVDEIASPPLKVTGWGYSSQGRPTEDGKELLLTLHVTIGAIEGQGVDVPEITVELLKNQNEELLLLRAEVEAAPKGTEQPKEECHGSALLCQWRHTIDDTFSALRTKIHGIGTQAHKKPGCKGKGMGHHSANGAGHKWRPHGPPAHAPHVGEDWGADARKHHRPGGHDWEHKDGEFKHHGGHHGHHGHHGPPDGMHHGPHGPHGPHGHHGHHGHGHSGFGRVMHVLGDVASHVIAPMLFGLVIGMLLVFVGWSLAVLASIVVAYRAGEAFSWDNYVPRWRGGYAAVDETDNDDLVVYVADEDFVDIEKLDEKAGLLSGEQQAEAPPVYFEVDDKE